MTDRKKKSPRFKEAESDNSHRFSDVNNRFLELRLEKKMSQEEWGEVFNLKRTSISAIELDRQAVPIYAMQKIHRKFGVDLNWFLCGDEPKSPDAERVARLEKELDSANSMIKVLKEALDNERMNTKALRRAFGVDDQP